MFMSHMRTWNNLPRAFIFRHRYASVLCYNQILKHKYCISIEHFSCIIQLFLKFALDYMAYMLTEKLNTGPLEGISDKYYSQAKATRYT